MKTLDLHHCSPTKRQIALAREFGDDSLGFAPSEEFHEDSPVMPGFERGEPGCLMSMNRCVMPHTDSWLGAFGGEDPRVQRSLFWVITGIVIFKVDGWEGRSMGPGDWVVFDHRREHMVLANGKWTGAAWQIKPVRKARTGAGNKQVRRTA